MTATDNQFLVPFKPDAGVLLELWLDQSSADERDPIGIKGEPAYRYFWKTWLKYLESGRNGLQPEPINWDEITPTDVLGFLSAGPRGRKMDTDPTVITKRRYWRLLERIYEFARINKWVEQNAVALLAKTDIPPPEDPRGFILTPQLWVAALAALAQPVEEQPLPIRNRAIGLALFELALMPIEIRELTLASLVRRQVADNSWVLHALQVDGEGVGQLRKLTLSEGLRVAIEAWLEVRPLVAKSPEQRALFCARSSATEPITPTQLINIVTTLIKDAAEACGQPLPSRLGPQIVRNTRLAMWLNEGVPPSQVAVWAGLKEARGLYHLRQHLNPEVNVLINSSSKKIP